MMALCRAGQAPPILPHIQSLHPRAQLQCPKNTAAIPPGHEHGRVALQAGHGGVGVQTPYITSNRGTRFRIRRFWRYFRINIFCYSKNSCPQKCKMKSTSKDSNRGPLRYRSCIIQINQIVVVVYIGPSYGNPLGLPLHFDSSRDAWDRDVVNDGTVSCGTSPPPLPHPTEAVCTIHCTHSARL